MKLRNIAIVLAVLLGFLWLIAAPSAPGGEQKVVRGWLTDSACAPGRASGGLYDGGNPECAKKCVAEGKKIVFADPEKKMLFEVTNQDAAKDNIADYVEVAGTWDMKAKTVHIDSVKLLEKGRAKCGVPKKNNAPATSNSGQKP
jgi:hypothetical protein